MTSRSLNRRSFCALTSAGLALLNGCLWTANGPRSGSLILDNRHDIPHTVEVTLSRPLREDETPSPATSNSSRWTQTESYEVAATSQRTLRDFITEPGQYTLEARLDNGERDSGQQNLYRGGKNGTKIGGGIFLIEILSTGQVVVQTPDQWQLTMSGHVLLACLLLVTAGYSADVSSPTAEPSPTYSPTPTAEPSPTPTAALTANQSRLVPSLPRFTIRTQGDTRARTALLNTSTQNNTVIDRPRDRGAGVEWAFQVGAELTRTVYSIRLSMNSTRIWTASLQPSKSPEVVIGPDGNVTVTRAMA
jgi:hypothetical protein